MRFNVRDLTLHLAGYLESPMNLKMEQRIWLSRSSPVEALHPQVQSSELF